MRKINRLKYMYILFCSVTKVLTLLNKHSQYFKEYWLLGEVRMILCPLKLLWMCWMKANCRIIKTHSGICYIFSTIVVAWMYLSNDSICDTERPTESRKRLKLLLHTSRMVMYKWEQNRSLGTKLLQTLEQLLEMVKLPRTPFQN